MRACTRPTQRRASPRHAFFTALVSRHVLHQGGCTRRRQIDFTKRDQARVGAAIQRHSAPPAPRSGGPPGLCLTRWDFGGSSTTLGSACAISRELPPVTT